MDQRQGCLLSSLLFSIVLEVLSRTISIGKGKKKGIQIRKEEDKFSLSADDMILYIKTLKIPPKILELINNFNKIVGHKINIQNNKLLTSEIKKNHSHLQ